MQRDERINEYRAAAPKLPSPTPTFQRDRKEYQRYREDREKVERRSVTRGLILLAVVLLVASMARAGLDRVFVHGWWRP